VNGQTGSLGLKERLRNSRNMLRVYRIYIYIYMGVCDYMYLCMYTHTHSYIYIYR